MFEINVIIVPLLTILLIMLVANARILLSFNNKHLMPYSISIIGIFCWGLLHIMELLAHDLQTKVVFFLLRTASFNLIIPCWILFLLGYGRIFKKMPAYMWLIFVIPIIGVIIILTNQKHHLIWQQFHLAALFNWHILAFRSGSFVWGIQIYFALTALLTSFLSGILIKIGRDKVSLYSGQLALLSLLAIFLIGVEIIYLPGISFSPSLLILPAMLSMTSFFWQDYSQWEITSRAVNDSLAELNLGLIVNNRYQSSISMNSLAQKIFQQANALNKKGEINRTSELWARLTENNFASEEPVYIESGYPGRLQVRRLPLTDQNKKLIGNLLILQDVTELHKTQAALRSSSLQLDLLMEQIDEILITVDSNLRVTYVSPSIGHILDFPPERVVGRSVYDITIHPQDRDKIIRLLHLNLELSSETKLPLIPVRLRTANNEWRSFEANSRSLRGIPGVAGMVIVLRDVTEESQNRKALTMLSDVLSATSDAMIIQDHLGKIERWNTAASKLYGWQEEETKGKYLRDVLHPQALDEQEQYQRRIVRNVIKYNTWSGDLVLQSKNGELIDTNCLIVAIRGQNQKVQGYIGIYRDISVRKAHERRLQETLQQLEKIFHTAPIGMTMVNKDGHYQQVNQAFCKLVGYSESELLERSFWDISQKDELELDSQVNEYIWYPPYPLGQIEKHYVHKSGKLITVLLTLGVMPNGDDAPTRAIAYVIDISQRSIDEQKLRQAQKLESIGLLAGGIAHDFNNLLTAIMANISLAKMRITHGASAIDNLKKAENAAESAANLAQQLLAFAGKGELRLEMIDVEHTLHDILSFLRASIPGRIKISLDCQAPFPKIKGDKSQLQQILMNLVLNASEAIPETTNGEISISAEAVEVDGAIAHLVHEETLLPGKYIRIKVQDNGIGMNADTLERIFDPYFTTKTYGHGLGLSAALGIVRAHHAGLTVQSTPNSGSIFELYWPSSANGNERAPVIPEITIPPAKSGISKKPKVLIIDDEDSIRDVLRDSLEFLDYEVLDADNEENGIALFSEHRADIQLVVLDMKMQGIGGLGVLKALRALSPKIPVLISSGYQKQDDLDKLLAQPFISFLPKPYDIKTLNKAIRSTLKE